MANNTTSRNITLRSGQMLHITTPTVRIVVSCELTQFDESVPTGSADVVDIQSYGKVPVRFQTQQSPHSAMVRVFPTIKKERSALAG